MNLIAKIRKKYTNFNVQLKVVFWFTFVGFLQRGISIITTPVFTRVLNQEEYGMFSVFSAWFYVLAIICTLNIHQGAINNALTKMPNEKERIISSFQSLSLVIASGFLLISIFLSKDISKWMNLPEIVVVFMFVGFLFYEPYNDWLIYKRYQYDYKKPVLISIIISMLTPIISVLAVMTFTEFRGEARIISFIIVNVVFPGAVFYFVNYRSGKIFYDRKLWSYALMFNAPLIPHFLSETILNQSDKIMIGVLVGTGEAGVYNIAYAAASLILIFSSALNIAFVPWQYQKIRDKEYLKLAKMSYTVLASVGLLIIVLIMFAPEIIEILAGESYMGAVELVPILGMSVFFNYMYQLLARVELYYEKKSYTVIATLGATILNICLNMWWIHDIGYYGAGYSTLIAHIFLCVAHFLFYKRICRDNNIAEEFYSGKIILLVSTIFVVCSLVVIPLYKLLSVRIAIVTIISILVFVFRRKLKNMFVLIKNGR